MPEMDWTELGLFGTDWTKLWKVYYLPSSDGGHRQFSIESTDGHFKKIINFQSGNPLDGINGHFAQLLLQVIANEIISLDTGQWEADENKEAVQHIYAANAALQRRRERLAAQGAETK